MSKKLVKVATHIGQPCEVCEDFLDSENLEGAINHYVQKHGFNIKHIGTETETTDSGQLWYCTAAYLEAG